MEITRRNLFGVAFGAAAAREQQSRPGGVTVGVHTYSFRDRSLDAAIAAMAGLGVGECDLSGIHLEPRRTRPPQPNYRELVREWRLKVPIEDYQKVGQKFRAAGIRIDNYTHNFLGGPDAEIERGFEMAKALGAKSIATSTLVSLAQRIDAVARRHKMRAGLHNHARIEPDQMATPDDFAAALRGRSEYLSITLDIGHFVAAGFDPVDFLRRNHSRILSLHLKDRKKNQGPNVPFGEGDTPIKEVLRMVRDNKYDIPNYIEYEYEGQDSVAEVRKSLDFCKRALLA